MKPFYWRMKAVWAGLPLCMAVLVSGCGGGGGGASEPPAPTSSIISGTAAAGAPVVGYVSVRDSSTNQQPVLTNIAIEANGHYSVDVAGLQAPYAFLASGSVGGKTVSYYSAATAADAGKTINITPFTDLMIRNIAATAVDAFLATPAGMASLTTAELDAQRVALTSQLAPALQAMGLSDSVDLLRTVFNADGTGLDRFMDVVKVSTTSTTATITNILDAANSLTIDTATGASTGTLGTSSLATSGTPADLIRLTFNSFSNLFATGLPASNHPALVALFSSEFIDDGESSAAMLTDLTTDSQLIGLVFSNLVIDSVSADGTRAQVRFIPVNKDGVKLADEESGGAIGWQMRKAQSGAWQFDGNQRIAHVSVRTTAEKSMCNPAGPACTFATSYRTGLHFDIDNRAMLAIGSAVVTGPGLPAGGVTLVAQIDDTWFNITTSDPSNPSCAGCRGNNWYMVDADIAAVLPDSTYTVALWSNAATPVLLATYTDAVKAAPVLNTAVAALAYPSLSGMTNLAGAGAVTLTPAWTIPAGLRGSNVGVNVWQQGSAPDLPGPSLSVWADLSGKTASSGSSSLAISAPPTGSWMGGNYWIDARDEHGGQVNTNYQGN
jgi:hypothetical protein